MALAVSLVFGNEIVAFFGVTLANRPVRGGADPDALRSKRLQDNQ